MGQELEKYLRGRTLAQYVQDPALSHVPALERQSARCQCIMGTGVQGWWAALAHAPLHLNLLCRLRGVLGQHKLLALLCAGPDRGSTVSEVPAVAL